MAMNDAKTVDVLKGLVIDGVDAADSGHPGGAMSSMDFAYILFTEFLRFDPEDHQWQGRDRFVLSAGHESMLLYSLLHMVGWLPKDALQNFRQLHSQTPGHPEVGVTPGVECTTGPLGQGAAMAVGMAIAAKHLATRFGSDLFGQRVFALLGDGCMQEGITYGAASLAGHLKLNNLVWYYDRNSIQISGAIDRAYSDDAATVYKGLGWQVKTVDGHDHAALRAALTAATTSEAGPHLIIGDSKIGKGAFSMEGQAGTHGAPLPKDERQKTRTKFGLPEDEAFYCPQEARQHFQRNFGQKSQEAQTWRKCLTEKQKATNFAQEYQSYFQQAAIAVPNIAWDRSKSQATRGSFGQIIEAWADAVPQLIGGSADLEPSNMTGAFAKKVGDFAAGTYQNRNLAFGVREFPMSAIANGMALFGGLIPFDATFLTFSDYSRPALRLGCIQGTRVIHEFTHDSFYLGEDGPTHQPVEHIMSLRSMPDLYVMRPADPVETEEMMRVALNINKNTIHCLTRQGVPFLDDEALVRKMAKCGAYTVKDCPDPELIIFATGSEVHLALAAAAELGRIPTKVVSMPCWELFSEQGADYQSGVLSWSCQRRVAIEAGTTLGWERFVGHDGLIIGRDTYGDSAPNKVLAATYGFTAKAVAEKITQKWF